MENLGGLDEVEVKENKTEETVVSLEEKKAKTIPLLGSNRPPVPFETQSIYSWETGKQISSEYHEYAG